MIRVNENYLKLNASYLFSTINKKIAAHKEKNPSADIIRLGIGDVTKPLPAACIKAFHEGVDDLAAEASFKGYENSGIGYDFLRQAIAKCDFQDHGVDMTADEIIVSDGAKCDTGNFQELFDQKIRIGVPDPVYPVYVDTNVMAGRTGPAKNGRYAGLSYLEATPSNGFVPEPPKQALDLVYLCFPNNPTGATATRDQLASWVDYARRNKALILFDAAYVAFIRDPSLPKSIFEIPGARECAVEFRSYSKTAGFTGTRCAYTVIPNECTIADKKGGRHSLQSLWTRRHTTKFNGVSYPVQRAAAAVHTPEGQAQVKALADYYLENARVIRAGMEDCGYQCTGGDNSPYIWVRTGEPSWDFFDRLLTRANVVTTPGAGFGRCGEGFIRISAFNDINRVREALDRIRVVLK